MHIFSLLFVSVSIGSLSALNVSDRSADAMDPEFFLKALPEMNKYFLTKTEKEPRTPFLIQRRWKKDKKLTAPREKRASGNGTTGNKGEKEEEIELVIGTQQFRAVQYVYAAFFFLLSLGLLSFSVSTIFKTGAVVTVINKEDANCPKRGLPVTLTMFATAKRRGATQTETQPPPKLQKLSGEKTKE